MKFLILSVLFSFPVLAQEESAPGSNVDMRRLQIESESRRERENGEREKKKAENLRAHYEKKREEIDRARGRKKD